ncbi:MAG: MBL fold metallo-hydrolase [Desulfosarcina sp.]|nr:MBL fold metallo-hydrolase [Desulfobacterales bacterium]
MSLCVLASCSRGNSVYLASGDCALLIDAGLSGREIERRFQQQNLNPHHLTAILVTHEHSDHIRGVGVLARRFNLPVYMTAPTHQASREIIGRLPACHYFQPGTDFTLANFRVHPFALSHDAVDPVGFTFSHNGSRIGMATDLGIATGLVEERLRGCDLLFVEANHDTDMLAAGPYPWHLKQRIRSRHGHLSNTETGTLLRKLAHRNLRQIVLGHLSETNNSPQVAYKTVQEALAAFPIPITTATQDKTSPVFRLDPNPDFPPRKTDTESFYL